MRHWHCYYGIMRMRRAFLLYQVSNLHGKEDEIPATLTKIQYNCEIINNILRTTINQTFSSKSSEEISETQYLFPIDDNICMESFVAKYQDKTIKGIIKSKKDAQQEYFTNKQQGNVVSYAEQSTKDNEEYIKIKLGNLPPKEEVHITITYSQQLQCYLNKYYMVNIPIQQVTDDVQAKLGQNLLKLNITCTGRITYAESTEKKKLIQRTMLDEYNVQFIIDQLKDEQNHHIRVLFSYEGMFEPQVMFGDSKIFNEDSVKSALIPPKQSVTISFLPDFNQKVASDLDDALKASITNGEDVLSSEQFEEKVNEELIDHLKSSRSEYLFLLDRSGSMRGQPLQKAIEALKLFLQSLPNDSYFNIVSFGTNCTNLYQKSQKYSSQTLKYSIEKISQFSANMGGTEILIPLRQIFGEKRIKGYNKQIFILTDGAVQNCKDVIRLIKKNNKNNRVHLIGFGSGVDKYLIEESAIAGKGISQLTSFDQDLSGVIIKMLCQTISPTLDNFKITYDENIFESVYPEQGKMPCIFKDEIFNLNLFLKPLLKLEDLAEEKKIITISYHDSTLKQDMVKQIKLESSDMFTCNPELRESVFKIGKQQQLVDFIENSNILPDRIENQAIDFQLMTKLTAMICVIQKLNDEQKAVYESLPKTFYAQKETFYDSYYDNQSNLQYQQDQYYSTIPINSCFRNRAPAKCSTSSISNSMAQDWYEEEQKSDECKVFEKLSIDQVVPLINRLPKSDKKKEMKLEQLANNIPVKKPFALQKLASLSDASNNKHSIMAESNKPTSASILNNSRTSFSRNSNMNNNNNKTANLVNNSVKSEQKDTKMKQSTNSKRDSGQEEKKISIGQSVKQTPILLENDSKYMKLEQLIGLADSEGVWKYDDKLIKSFISAQLQALNALSASIKNKDLFMTLVLICILEKLYTSQKQKWILISKKSLSSVKDSISQEEVTNLKQQILNIIG